MQPSRLGRSASCLQDVDSRMVLNNYCWFGKFSIMKGWRSVFFFPSLQSMTTLVRKALPTTPPRLYSATQMWIFRNSFSLNQEQPSTSTPPFLPHIQKRKKKSGMGMDSSNVDKGTRLIPCRCACELREGALRCPRSRENGTPPWRKFSELRGENSSEAQYSWF